MKQYILSLDQGTTSSRALLFDLKGRLVASGQQEFPQYYPQPGWVEHNPDEIWSSMLQALKTAVNSAGIQSSSIICAGIANQRETVVLWDKQTGQALGPAIVWQCRRTAGICEKLIQSGKADLIKQKTGLVIDAYFSATKIKWMLDHYEGVSDKLKRGCLAAGTIDSWLMYRLTGFHGTDPSNACRTMLYNIHTSAWDEELLSLFGIPESILPRVQPSAGFFAKTSFALTGTAIDVTGIAGDQQAALFGQGCFLPGSAKNTYGTGCFLLCNTGNKIVDSKNNLLTSIAWDLGQGPVYCLEGSVFAGGAVIQWLRDSLGIISHAKESEQMALSVDSNLGVYFIPAFVGLGAPYWDSNVRGSLLGLTRGADKNHICRAALESIAFQSMDLLSAMKKDMHSELVELKVDGGACANNFLMQFQADLLGIPVMRPANVETTAAGAASLAAIGSGLYTNLDELSSVWKTEKTFQPSIPDEHRKMLVDSWHKAVQAAQSF